MIDKYVNKIINADCLDILKQLPDKCIDLILTDPPYGISCDGGSYGLGVKPKQLTKKSWDDSIPLKIYFDEMFRVSKEQIIFGGNYFTEYLKPTKAWIVWDKIGNLQLQNNFSQCELIWTSLKSVTKKITFIQQGFINNDKTENKLRFHPTQKPLKLISMLLNDYSNENDLILDCFSGSGTTAVACHNLKRRFICIEKDYDYWKASCERLEDAQRQLRLF
ncbi:MAG: DNA-methyltransferase [Candidatus Gastranaerophilaceae bacterium]